MPNRHRILIVDDDPGLRDGLTEQLSLYEEFEAVTVENGVKSVQAARAGRPGTVLLGRSPARIASSALN
jgi:DNA-binding response OmpR family regulator